ncbi:MAG: amidohydrolase family protein [Chromatiales bacterium]|jgi:N-acyl-D-amino-acid deacylase|nr:amidohydrolase family protein [Chromatiales bacterium]
MKLDLIIRDGTIIDGSGMPRYRADVGISNGKVVEIGRLGGPAREVIEAEGQVVAPGFIDGHTHMDAQVSWDPLGTCSCWHGVTSVLMGNCGFTLAPCRESEKDLVLRNLERAEDISPAAMEAGIDWTWETFPEYLDRLDELPKGINYGAYVGHSALRTYAMGEKAFEAQASEDELAIMCRQVRDAIRAGAIGFSSSRSPSHLTPEGQPVASRVAPWSEVQALVGEMGKMNAGIFEVAQERPAPDRIHEWFGRMKDLAVDSGRPITWGVFSRKATPELWRQYFELLDETAAAGGRMFAQVHSRALTVLLSFETRLPFDPMPVWSDMRKKPLAEQKAMLQDPAFKAKLLEVARNPDPKFQGVGAEARLPEYDWIYFLDTMKGPHRTVSEIAAERGVEPAEAMIDLALERDMHAFFMQPIANENQDYALEMMKKDRSIVTFSDSGAHVSQIMDSSLQTHLFSHWVRERQAFTLEEAVREVTFLPASAWSLPGRGLLRPGYCADVVIFDPDTIGPQMPTVVSDLPAGAKRLKQKADGIAATIVNGEVVLRNQEPTGALSGQVLRGPLAS